MSYQFPSQMLLAILIQILIGQMTSKLTASWYAIDPLVDGHELVGKNNLDFAGPLIFEPE